MHIELMLLVLHRRQKSALSKYKNATSDRDLKLRDLEGLLSREKEESKKHLNLIEEEVRDCNL